MEPHRLFILRLDHRLNLSLNESIIGVGWAEAGGLLGLTGWDDYKDHLRKSYPDLYVNKERRLGNHAGSVWRFLKTMAPEDRVIVPDAGKFHVARVKGNAHYDPAKIADDFAYRRQVVWEKKGVPRNHANTSLQRWMKARQTCVEVSEGLDLALNEALLRNAPLKFTDDILRNAGGAVAQALHESVTDLGLEKVVCQLAKASGAVAAEIPPKNSELDGDADVIATYDLRIPDADAMVHVAYQVKQHEGETGDWGVQQLIARMKEKSITRGCLVTTAKKVSDEAIKMAEEAEEDIVILTENHLVEWVLSVGLDALRE